MDQMLGPRTHESDTVRFFENVPTFSANFGHTNSKLSRDAGIYRVKDIGHNHFLK